MNRKVCLYMACILAAGAIVGVLTHADEQHGDHDANLTVQGEILDMACYVGHGATGPDHAACAKRCVKGGQPMGLLADDGTVYLLYADHADSTAFEAAKEFAGEKVEIKGKPASQSGVKGIEVHAVKTL